MCCAQKDAGNVRGAVGCGARGSGVLHSACVTSCDEVTAVI
jgi:hypothetical protein